MRVCPSHMRVRPSHMRAVREPRLLAQDPATLLRSLEVLSTTLGLDPEQCVQFALRNTAMFVMNDEHGLRDLVTQVRTRGRGGAGEGGAQWGLLRACVHATLHKARQQRLWRWGLPRKRPCSSAGVAARAVLGPACAAVLGRCARAQCTLHAAAVRMAKRRPCAPSLCARARRSKYLGLLMSWRRWRGSRGRLRSGSSCGARCW